LIARIASRGHSFKGAGLYYLHDKEASTTERVEWTEVRNIPVGNPEAATNYMAYTAINSNRIKQDAGVPLTGRKRKKGVVYTFSLSWSPEEKPDKEIMLKSADETLSVLGLKDHQSLIVAHSDTKHPHIHVICNLINPNDGRMYDPDWGSKLKMSDWSLKHEMDNGKVYCEQRAENHEKRKRGERVKYQEPLHDRKAEIQQLYRQSDNGASFTAALKEQGYTLAKGNRRRFVLVDNEGKIHSLSRQLDKTQRKDHLQKLSDLKQQELPVAKVIAEERQYFDRDKQIAEQEQKNIDAAIATEQLNQEQEREGKFKKPSKDFLKAKSGEGNKKEKEPLTDSVELAHQQSKMMDKKIAWSREAQRVRLQKRKELREFYTRSEHVRRIEELEEKIATKGTLFGKVTGSLQLLQDELDAERKTLEVIDGRIVEQMGAVEAKIQESNPTKLGVNKEDLLDSADDRTGGDLSLEQKRAAIRKQQLGEQKTRDKDKNQDFDR